MPELLDPFLPDDWDLDVRSLELVHRETATTVLMQMAEVQRLRDALKPFAAIDLTTNQAVDPMDVLRARRALEGK